MYMSVDICTTIPFMHPMVHMYMMSTDICMYNQTIRALSDGPAGDRRGHACVARLATNHSTAGRPHPHPCMPR